MIKIPADKVIFYGIFILIVILLLVNVRVGDLRQKFDTYCTKDYDITSPCPCIKAVNTGFQPYLTLNNETNQKLLDKQNLSAS